jgi:hypothetical protein
MTDKQWQAMVRYLKIEGKRRGFKKAEMQALLDAAAKARNATQQG